MSYYMYTTRIIALQYYNQLSRFKKVQKGLWLKERKRPNSQRTKKGVLIKALKGLLIKALKGLLSMKLKGLLIKQLKKSLG